MTSDHPTPDRHYAVTDLPPLADTRHIRRKYLDVAYAPAVPCPETGHLFAREGDGPFPVIVSIHGGAFMGCDKADMQVMPMLAGLKRGYAVVAINYRLSGEAKFPALVQDAKAAIRWIRANAARFGFDPRSHRPLGRLSRRLSSVHAGGHRRRSRVGGFESGES